MRLWWWRWMCLDFETISRWIFLHPIEWCVMCICVLECSSHLCFVLKHWTHLDWIVLTVSDIEQWSCGVAYWLLVFPSSSWWLHMTTLVIIIMKTLMIFPKLIIMLMMMMGHLKRQSLELFLWIYIFLPSVLWRCWLGGRKGIRPVKNWVVRCWCGYLSGARCRLAYGPADAAATHCLLLQ